MSSHHLWVTAKDTIVALATCPSQGSITILRLSGQKSIAIASRLSKKKLDTLNPNNFIYSQIVNVEGEHLDNAIILRFKAPKSFTGEDVVEIQFHASPLIAHKLLQAALNLGARAAEPGEFSFRAFRNGKIDLCQAESISTLITAKNAFAMKAAHAQLSGSLSKTILAFQEEITDIIAILEAMIDYPEEGINYPTTENLLLQMQEIHERITKLQKTFTHGKKLVDSVRIGIIGKTNVGKSSLLNLLVKKNRAIVTDIQGTTRDQIEEEIQMDDGHLFCLIDTAGIRDTSDKIEAIGIERSKKVLKEADLVLFVLDASKNISQEETSLINTLVREKSLLIYNKHDVRQNPCKHVALDSLEISTKTSHGLSDLKKWLIKKSSPPQESLFITQERHAEALKNTLLQLEKAIQNIPTAPLEITAIDLRNSLSFLSQIIGKNISQDVLASIFKNFCVGK